MSTSWATLKARLSRTRRSRTLYRLILILSLTVSLACAVILLIDHFLDSHKKISPLIAGGRFVGVGTAKTNSLASISANGPPVFSMCPVGHGLWKLGFHWVVNVKGDPEEFIRSAPDIYVAGPPDLYDAQAELSNEYNLLTGDITPSGKDVTKVEALGKNEYFTMLRARPTVAAEMPDGRFTAGYVFTFLTHNVTVNSYGLGVKGFSVSYATGVMRGTGFYDGLGGARLPASEKYIVFQTCNNESTTWKIETETLRPLPSATVAQEGLQWKTGINKGISITGHVHGGWRYDLRRAAGLIILNSVFALLGALYGAGLESKQPMDTPFDSKRSQSKNQRQTPERKDDKSAGLTRRRRKTAKLVLRKDSTGQFYFNLVAPNDEIIARSEGYKSKIGALNGIKSVKRNAPNAEIDDLTDK